MYRISYKMLCHCFIVCDIFCMSCNMSSHCLIPHCQATGVLDEITEPLRYLLMLGYQIYIIKQDTLLILWSKYSIKLWKIVIWEINVTVESNKKRYLIVRAHLPGCRNVYQWICFCQNLTRLKLRLALSTLHSLDVTPSLCLVKVKLCLVSRTLSC